MTTTKLLAIGLAGFFVGVAPDVTNLDPTSTIGGAGLGLGATLVWTFFGLARKLGRALDAAVEYFRGQEDHRKAETAHFAAEAKHRELERSHWATVEDSLTNPRAIQLATRQ